MGAMVMRYSPMPPGMRRHADCLLATYDLETELFGEVLSASILEPLERYSWWPLTGPPPVPVSLQSRRQPPPPPKPSKGGPTTAR